MKSSMCPHVDFVLELVTTKKATSSSSLCKSAMDDTKPSGVKALHESGVAKIPKKYIKPEALRAKQDVKHGEGIPVIDIFQLEEVEHRKHVVEEIASAACEWGFFQVKNHGVPLEVTTSMLEIGREFFNLPLEEKMKYFSEEFRRPVRYCTSFMPSLEDHWDWHDNFQHYFPPHGEDHPWPMNPPRYKEIAQEYVKQVSDLGRRICAALSEGLGLPRDKLDGKFGKNRLLSMRLNYFAPCPNPELTLGQSAHSDFGAMTIVLQDGVEGLQVINEGEWFSVKPVKGSFVVNIGDQLQIWSNGKYQSAEHRVVVNPKKERLSIAMFFEPSLETFVEPIEDLISEDEPPRFKGVDFGDFLKKQSSSYLDGKNTLRSLQV